MFFDMMKWFALRLFCGTSWMATPPAVVELASCPATPPAVTEFAGCPLLVSVDRSVTFVKKRGGSKLFIDTEMG